MPEMFQLNINNFTMRKVALLFGLILITACGSSENSKPTLLTGGLFVNASADSQTPTVLNFNGKGTEPTVDLSKGGVILLTFSGLLKGSSVEQITRDPVTQAVKDFSAVANLVSVTIGGQNYSTYTVQYRPDGGYIPPLDTTADNFPKPAIAISLPADAVSSGKQVIVKLNDQVVVGIDGVSVGTGSVSLTAK